MNLQNNNNKRVNVKPTDMKAVKCVNPGCDSTLFNQHFMVNSVSGMLVGTPGQDKIIPMPVFACKECGTVLKFDSSGKPLPHEGEE